jgi:hypothetical protein
MTHRQILAQLDATNAKGGMFDLNLTLEQLPSAQEDNIKHRLGETAGLRVLLAHMEAPK